MHPMKIINDGNKDINTKKYKYIIVLLIIKKYKTV